MKFRSFKRRALPSAKYFANDFGGHGRSRYANSWRARPAQQIVALAVAAALTTSGVAAAVAITLRGNNSTEDGVISLGVGQAVATSCDKTTTTKTDTISQYVDSYSDFILQRLEVYNVEPTCEGRDMNLVVNMSSGANVDLTCKMPASNSFSGWTTSQYNQATFIFTTAAFTTTAVGQYSCNANGYIPYSPTPMYMASISAVAVQLK
jgi:hypothetical protein